MEEENQCSMGHLHDNMLLWVWCDLPTACILLAKITIISF